MELIITNTGIVLNKEEAAWHGNYTSLNVSDEAAQLLLANDTDAKIVDILKDDDQEAVFAALTELSEEGNTGYHLDENDNVYLPGAYPGVEDFSVADVLGNDLEELLYDIDTFPLTDEDINSIRENVAENTGIMVTARQLRDHLANLINENPVFIFFGGNHGQFASELEYLLATEIDTASDDIEDILYSSDIDSDQLDQAREVVLSKLDAQMTDVAKEIVHEWLFGGKTTKWAANKMVH